MKLETMGVATPVARVGIERVSMKTDLIPPEKMKLILVESARARLLNEVRTFVCTNCWGYLEMIRMKDLPEKPACPRCGSSSLGVLGREEGEVQSLVDKRGEKLTKVEEKMKEWAVKTARLMAGHGKPAAVALSGRKLAVSDVEGILKEEKTLSDHFFELVIDAERDALKRRFW
jgi:ATP-dependent Lhr-like helicase